MDFIDGFGFLVLKHFQRPNPIMSENPKTVVAFLKLLAKQLYEPLLRERSENLHISRELKSGIFRVLNLTSSETPAYNQEVLPRNQRKYCSICDPKLKRKTGEYVSLCIHANAKCPKSRMNFVEVEEGSVVLNK
nr:unnamed protein product [Callosobruchus chinensis]